MAPETERYSQLSFWLDSVPRSLKPRATLSSDITADVAIVGAGYTGLWTAYYLNQIDPTLDIVILEAEIAGYGASGRNGGWCAAYLSGIEHWLDNPATREAGIRLQRAMFETVREVGEVTKKESIDCHFDPSGALEIAVIPEQHQKLKKELDYFRALGFTEDDYRWLDVDELRGTLAVDQALSALHMNHCAAIHPARLSRGLAETLESKGMKIYEQSPVVSISQNVLSTGTAKVTADAVVVATEGYSGTIRDRKRRLVPVHSMMVVTEPLSDQQRDEIQFQKRYCFGNLDRLVTYGQLTADNRIAFGCRGTYHYGSHIRSFDPGDLEFDQVRQTLLRFFPSLEGIGFTHAWGGCMGVSRSLRPSVNFDNASRFGWAGGYFGNGVGATHLSGRTMADLVLNRGTDRAHLPWVNPESAEKKWEPEPLRWLGVKTRAKMMHLADWAEYRGSRLAPITDKAIETLFP